MMAFRRCLAELLASPSRPLRLRARSHSSLIFANCSSRDVYTSWNRNSYRPCSTQPMHIPGHLEGRPLRGLNGAWHGWA